MKILIYTLPPYANYGCILQAYALQTVLQRMGHKVKVVGCDRVDLIPSIPFRLWIHAIGNFLLRRGDCGYKIFYESRKRRDLIKITRAIDFRLKKFKNNTFKFEKRIPQNIRSQDYDTIVVGSDQIWRPKYCTYPIEDSFLNFAKGWNIKRIVYAASFGTDEWEYSSEQESVAKQLLAHFDAVSVREASAVQLCKKHFSVDAVQVLDPTLLLDREDYLRLIKNIPAKSGGVFAYILDRNDEKRLLVEKISTLLGTGYRYGGALIDDWTAPIEQCIQPPLEDWLVGFRDADFIVTDSFHGCVFSIIFGKPFVVIGNAERGLSRIKSLITLFGLSNHYINDIRHVDNLKQYQINSSTFEKLGKERKKSFSFLIKNVSKSELHVN